MPLALCCRWQHTHKLDVGVEEAAQVNTAILGERGELTAVVLQSTGQLLAQIQRIGDVEHVAQEN